MATLILDIKTVGESWDELDTTTKAHLMRWVDRTARSQAERQLLRDELLEGLGLSPFTGHLVTVGVYDRARGEGVVYAVTTDPVPTPLTGRFAYKVATEAAALCDFWDGVRQYDTVVTFGGRTFALPFLLHRSVACGVAPTVDLLRKRYLTQQSPPYHVDLQDEISFYGALTRRPSLHMVCRSYGIEHPGGEVSDGLATAQVPAGNPGAVAAQATRDVTAIAALYETWLQYLAPRDFIQHIDF